MTRFPDPDFTPPSPPFHVPHTVLYTKYPSKSCSSVVGGREKRARAFSRVSCACTAKHTRKESEAPGYADPSGTDFAPESSAVCFRFHCRSIDLQYLENRPPPCWSLPTGPARAVPVHCRSGGLQHHRYRAKLVARCEARDMRGPL